jgi:small subunit ribosomal protein S21
MTRRDIGVSAGLKLGLGVALEDLAGPNAEPLRGCQTWRHNWTDSPCSGKRKGLGGARRKRRVVVYLEFRAPRPKQEDSVQVLVRDNNVDQALKALKKKMQREGIFREMKLRGHYEKPSERRAREKAEAVRRARKLARKKMQREGLLPMKPKPTLLGAR